MTGARRNRKPVIALAAVAVTLAALAALAIDLRYRHHAMSFVHSSRAHLPPEAEAQAFAEFPQLEKIALRTSDGLTLRGWFSPGSRRSAVVLLHGGLGNRLMLLPEARALARHRYGFLLYDSRASGESEGDLNSWGEYEQRDLTAAVDFLSARPEIDPSRIAALGFSVGGTTVALGAARDQRIRAVILYATFTSLEDEMDRKLGKFGRLSLQPALGALRDAGLDLNSIRPIDHIREISPRPLLMVAGADDRDTPLLVMEKVFAAAGEPKEMVVVPGADHGEAFLKEPARVEAKLIEFLDRSFFPGPVPSPPPAFATPADNGHPIH